MKRKRVGRPRVYYEDPRESELQAVKTQRKFGYSSCGCIVLLVICLYLWGQGFWTTPVASIVFLLLCISVLAHMISVFVDGFFATGSYIIRGGYGIFEALRRLGALLIVGMFLLWIMSN